MDGGLRSLIKLIAQYPQAMEKVQWLDVSPHVPNHGSDIGPLELSKMPAIRLITLRWGFGKDYKQYHHRYLDSGRWLYIASTLGRLRQAFIHPSAERPKLAMIFAPTEVWSYRGSAPIIASIKERVEKSFTLKEPSLSIWERFEIDMSGAWQEKYPGRYVKYIL